MSYLCTGKTDTKKNANDKQPKILLFNHILLIGKPLNGGYSNETWGHAQSLMMYDIAAIQQMYGANFNTNSGNTTYSFSTNTGTSCRSQVKGKRDNFHSFPPFPACSVDMLRKPQHRRCAFPFDQNSTEVYWTYARSLR